MTLPFKEVPWNETEATHEMVPVAKGDDGVGVVLIVVSEVRVIRIWKKRIRTHAMSSKAESSTDPSQQ